jgi:hypothetical protein
MLLGRIPARPDEKLAPFHELTRAVDRNGAEMQCRNTVLDADRKPKFAIPPKVACRRIGRLPQTQKYSLRTSGEHTVGFGRIGKAGGDSQVL